MSYFSEIYGDLELSARAKLVLATEGIYVRADNS